MKLLCDNTLKKYVPLNKGDLISAIERDFDSEHRTIDRRTNWYAVRYQDLVYFDLIIQLDLEDSQSKSLFVIGYEKYHGFTMSARNAPDPWWYEIKYDGGHPPTAAAQRLAKVMRSKFGVSESPVVAWRRMRP